VEATQTMEQAVCNCVRYLLRSDTRVAELCGVVGYGREAMDEGEGYDLDFSCRPKSPTKTAFYGLDEI
jgi:hypothetical protein